MQHRSTQHRTAKRVDRRIAVYQSVNQMHLQGVSPYIVEQTAQGMLFTSHKEIKINV